MNQNLRDQLPQATHATRFWWVRHARVPEVAHRMYGSLDVDCDTGDSALFQGIAARLPADALWITSPLKRTQQTAEALLAAGAEAGTLVQDADIVEQDFGDFNGMTHEELFAQREDAYLGFWPLSPEQQAPNGESFSMLRRRVESFINRMIVEHCGRDLVCVAHRGTILAALQIALDLPLRNSVSFDIGNVSLTRLTHHADVPEGGPQWRVVDVSWLP
ncbi:MAG: histidine phosphatase family protein [Granulosicoccus sp.]|nr:histidine phosphatase family protein [Granulosicoccus sp.]